MNLVSNPKSLSVVVASTALFISIFCLGMASAGVVAEPQGTPIEMYRCSSAAVVPLPPTGADTELSADGHVLVFDTTAVLSAGSYTVRLFNKATYPTPVVGQAISITEKPAGEQKLFVQLAVPSAGGIYMIQMISAQDPTFCLYAKVRRSMTGSQGAASEYPAVTDFTSTPGLGSAGGSTYFSNTGTAHSADAKAPGCGNIEYVSGSFSLAMLAALAMILYASLKRSLRADRVRIRDKN